MDASPGDDVMEGKRELLEVPSQTSIGEKILKF